VVDKPTLAYTGKEMLISLSVFISGIISIAIIDGRQLFCYTSHNQLDYSIWLANRQKYSLLATSTTS